MNLLLICGLVCFQFNDETEDFRDLAKFFVESRLLQQDEVQVVVEKAMNNYVIGSVLHPVCLIDDINLVANRDNNESRTESKIG